VDIGCGEGRVTRDLKAAGHNVTGVDAAPTLLAAARDADPAGTYLLADAAHLPFPDDSFDAVIAYNTLMDVADLPDSIQEAARVLTPGGRLCVAITHPVTNTGSKNADGHFVLDGPYFQTRRITAWARGEGLEMRFQGWRRPLTAYTRPLEDAGLRIEAIREPRTTLRDGTVATIPYHLWLRALKPRT
jgi:SAM-dependent methyltransferase